jgi:hypothetical protein
LRSLSVVLALLAGCTGSEPESTDDVLDLEGSTYKMILTGMTVVGADDALADVLSLFFTKEVVVEYTNVTDTSADMTIGYFNVNTDPLEQDECLPTVSLDGATLDADLKFSYGPTTTDFYNTDGSYTVNDYYVNGQITKDGSQSVDVTMGGWVDLRDIEATGAIPDAQGGCDTAAGFGLPCTPCSDNEELCLNIELVDLLANQRDAEMSHINPGDPPASCADDA